MLRIVERIMGEGYVTQGVARLADAGYALDVYREWEPAGDEVVPGAFVVEGHLLAAPDVLAELLGRAELVLHLDDTRTLAFHLVSHDGAISGADEHGLVAAQR